MMNAPLLVDDYNFLVYENKTFRQVLDIALHYGNGRLLGNLTAIMLVRNRPIMVAEKTLIMVAIAAIGARLIAGKDRTKEVLCYLLTVLLMFGAGSTIFANVFVWTSGFQNYVPSILAMLISTAAFLHNPQKKAAKITDGLLLVLFGIIGQLYVELHSLINLLVTLALLIYCAVRWRSKLVKSVIWFGSTAAGGGIMALIPILFSPTTDAVKNYRTLHLNGIRDIMTTAASHAASAARDFFSCQILIALLCAATLYFIKRQTPSPSREKLVKVCCIGLLTATFFGVFYSFFNQQTELKKFFIVCDAVMVLSCFVFFVCLGVLFTQIPKSTEKTLLLCSFAAAILSVCPMMIVSPFSPRCLLLSYCFLSSCLLLMLKLFLNQTQPVVWRRAILCGFCSFAALAVCLSIIFTEIGWMSRLQVAYVKDKAKEHPQKIEAIDLPSNYLCATRFWSLSRYYYNEEPGDIEIVFLDFDEWYANRQAEGWIK